MSNGITDSFWKGIQNALEGLDLNNALEGIAAGISQIQQSSVDLIQNFQPGGIFNATATFAGFGDFPDIPAGIAQVTGDFIQEVSGAVSSALEDAFKDFANDGATATYSPNTDSRMPIQDPPVTDAKVYVVNGVNQDQKSREAQAKDTANMMGTDATIVNNSSGGLMVDAFEYLGETFFGIPTAATETLSDEIVNNLINEQDMHIVGYSQGSTITAHALSLAVLKFREKGFTDDQIRDMMTEHLKVELVGTPLDMSNPFQVFLNVPPGPSLPGADLLGQKKLDWFFTTEDRLLHGGDPPSSETINKESGDPNFLMVRHENDFVATWVRDTGPADLWAAAALGELILLGPLIVFDPVGATLLAKRATELLVKLGMNYTDKNEISPGYHRHSVYYDYLQNEVHQS